eukprot:TRINITY_DN7097_c0_g1_i1.p1 TRINITY_DN7097_c0_g1~~TRINITY_DN7097_c0_g1_i1.p1  ORF type:complete len:442 (+),score=76.10 TRINITY_DN7097_c0_g1_i1:28-1326(+)
MFSILAFASVVAIAGAEDIYVLSEQGESCATACGLQGRECNPHIETDNSDALFQKLGIQCKTSRGSWWAADQPSYCSDPSDGNYGQCVGYENVPVNGSCQAQYWSVRRLCRCGDDNTQSPFFGTGYSAGTMTVNETTRFAHVLADGMSGVMTHFWLTCPPGAEKDLVIRYYIDNETTPSIEFNPYLAVGVGFNDSQAPWGTKWFGVGSGNSPSLGKAFNLNFQIPFLKSVRVTVQNTVRNSGGFYMIARGVANKKISIGGIDIPETARLVLQKQHLTMQPLDFLDVAKVESGSGLMFMSTLAVRSGNLNFLEGCFHAYTPVSMPWPGILLSTGTEDYYDSAWYFNAGEFHLPVSGFTHLNKSAGNDTLTWSAYRFHEQDPLPFSNGFRLQWRNGDMDNPVTGNKCFTQSGGRVVGHPTVSQVTTYAWVYVWD